MIRGRRLVSSGSYGEVWAVELTDEAKAGLSVGNALKPEVVLPPPRRRRRSLLRHALGIVATCALVFVCAPFGGMVGLALAHLTSVDRVHEREHLCTTTVYYPSESTWACTGGASLHVDGNSTWCQRP